ncbi:transmembrane protein [Diaporthe helianthi]|uniref:Transmembrane protein n=1 Tax=Diaporthe helianthi TaxID=158607 RepID=A0A2P5IEA3_DIAHE|nr:transmembrane protein [Diaporthe helianthi]
MAALANAAINHIVRELVDRQQVNPSAAFAIATAPNSPLPTPVGVDGFVSTAMTTTTTSIASTPTAMMATGAGSADEQGECRLLGPFALFVQLALGGLALLSLVYKRWRERPQRPLKIWFFDASKQVFGSVLVHVANVFMSMLTSGRFSIKVEPTAAATVRAVSMMVVRSLVGRDGQDGAAPDDEYTPNPCSFYLLNLAIDTTLGIPILILLLRVFTSLVSHTPLGQPPESIQSGNYGNPPNAWWWLKQSVIYFCGLFGMKVCVLIIFLMLPWISRIGDWALGWTEGNERVQIVFVMMLFPLIMNAMQYYIIDSFIKKPAEKDDNEGHDGSGASGGTYERIAEPGSDDDDDPHQPRLRSGSFQLEDEADAKSTKEGKKVKGPADEEYDPDLDGDRIAVVGSGSSPVRGVVKRELLPKE